MPHSWTSLSAIGAGLLYTTNENTPLGRLIGYQIIAGAGTGMCLRTQGGQATL